MLRVSEIVNPNVLTHNDRNAIQICSPRIYKDKCISSRSTTDIINFSGENTRQIHKQMIINYLKMRHKKKSSLMSHF